MQLKQTEMEFLIIFKKNIKTVLARRIKCCTYWPRYTAYTHIFVCSMCYYYYYYYHHHLLYAGYLYLYS